MTLKSLQNPIYAANDSDAQTETDIDLINDTIRVAETRFPGKLLILCHLTHGTTPYTGDYLHEVLGYDPGDETVTNPDEYLSLIHADDIQTVYHGLKTMREFREDRKAHDLRFAFSYRLKRKDGTYQAVTDDRVTLLSRNCKCVYFIVLGKSNFSPLFSASFNIYDVVTAASNREMVPLISNGLSNTDIAAHLGIDATVVRKRRELLMRSLGFTFMFTVCALLSLQCSAQKNNKKSGNPIIKGWYADPEAAVFGSNYWIYPTYSDLYEKQVFFDAFSSPDLVTWKRHERILDTASVKWARKAMWAPAIVQKDGRYFLFFAANDIQSDKESGGIGVAVSDKPEGPFKDYLGKPLIDHFENGAQPIDQFVFKDKDGKYYIIYGGWRHCNIARLKDDFTGLVPFDDGTTYREITPEGYVEGPFMFIKNDKYYFMWSEGGWTGPDYAVAYAISDSLTGPHKRVGRVLEQDSTVARGAGHHSIIHNPGSDNWYIVYHRRPLTETHANHRETCIDYMRFDESGKIRPVRISFEGVAAEKVK